MKATLPLTRSLIGRLFCRIGITIVALGFFTVRPQAQALNPSPDGGYLGGNTAEGQSALSSLTTGGFNAAVGYFSLFSNFTGSFNTAVGAGTLDLNAADDNTATGAAALLLNTIGADNTATGVDALVHNDTGSRNTATGAFALLSNTEASYNTAIGTAALFSNTTGTNNTAIGDAAGGAQNTGSGNVYIGAGVAGAAGESNACYIRSIFGQTSVSGMPVLVNSNNKLGTTTSSRRFKKDIKPMDKSSEALLALKPVTFRYKKEIDPTGKSQFGLVAEEVEKVNPDLLVHDKEGKPYSVRYDQVNAMLLNEFLKEHKRVGEQAREIQEQKSTISELRKGLDTVVGQLKEQAVEIQKVSARLETSKRASKVVVNSQ